MDMRYGREAIVGALVIAAIVIFVLGTMWLSGRSLGNRHLVRVQFSHVSGLKRASPVTISGVMVAMTLRNAPEVAAYASIGTPENFVRSASPEIGRAHV